MRQLMQEDGDEKNPRHPEFPESPLRKHDPNPDRIPRIDTNPAPNSTPILPSHPKILPTTNPPSF